MFDWIRAAPGVSPTSPSSGNITTVSVFGSGTNENQFLFDGTNFTCPCNGIARAEPGVDFIQEVHVQSTARPPNSATFKAPSSTSSRGKAATGCCYDSSYYAQRAGLTSRGAFAVPWSAGQRRATTNARDIVISTTSLGGPVVRDRLGSSSATSTCATMTVSLAPTRRDRGATSRTRRSRSSRGSRRRLTLDAEPSSRVRGLNPEQPTMSTPFEAILRRHARCQPSRSVT